MGVPLYHPFQMGILHEKTIQRAWGSPMELPGKTAWDQPSDRRIHWILQFSWCPGPWSPGLVTQNPCHGLRRGKAHGFHNHHPDLPKRGLILPGKFAFSLPSTRIEKLCGFRRLFAGVGYV